MNRKRRGFTLVEMLATTLIGSVVLLLGLAALNRTGDDYGRSVDGVAAEREARAILTQIADDMTKATGGYLEVDSSGGGWRQDSIAFTCLQPIDAQAVDEAVGDLCVVVYYLKDLAIGRATVRCLMRGFRDSQEVFEALRTDQVPALYDERPVDEPVAFGVVAFEVEPLQRTAAGALDQWQVSSGDIPPLDDLPDLVRLRLVVARRELAAKLDTSTDWDGSPLLGQPDLAEQSRRLEIYEITHPFGYAR